MKRTLSAALVAVSLAVSALLTPVRVPVAAAAPVGVTLIGKGTVQGTALDRSGLTGNICQAGNPVNDRVSVCYL
jgi:hypothetical protein